MSRRGGVAAVVGVAMVAMGLVLPSQPSTGAAPAPGEGRLAFTDGQDVVRRVGLSQSETSDGTPLLLPGQPADWTTVQASGRHSGEVRGEQVADQESPAGGYAFVSTRPTASAPAQDDPDGEVWYHAVDPETEAERDIQVTDDASAQAHPDALVMEKACYATDGPVTIDVAFASDRSGNWDIWVARLVRNPAPGSGCDDLVVESVQQVTTDPADDMWPSWAISRAGTRSIVFASTRSDPRGDLYQVVVDPGDPLPPPASAYTQLTEGPEADSQPAARLWVDSPQACPGDPGGGLAAPIEPTWVAFTRSSDDDPRGSLAVLDLDDPGGGVMGLGVPASSEPVWSPDGGFVSYRSTAEDPDGDVLIGRFVRECPPDLAVQSVTVSADPITFGFRADTFVRVVNNGPRPASGQVVVVFPPVVENPEGCVGRVCELSVPTLAQGEAREFAWTTIEFPPADMVVVGAAPVTTALGDGTVTATVAVDGPVPDAVPANDTGSTTFTVAPRPIDVQLASDPDSDGVTASPNPLVYADATPTLTTTVTVLVHNPGPIPVTTTIVVSSDSPQALSGGSQTVTRTITDIPPTSVGSPWAEDFDFIVQRPPANSPAAVQFTATLSVALPVIDPDPSNNVGGESVSLSYVVIAAVPEGSLQVTDGFYRGPTPAPVLRSGLVRSGLVRIAPGPAFAAPARAGVALPAPAPRAALVPLDVPPPAKPPVQDSVSLQWITPVSTTFGVSESHPAFGWVLNDGFFDPVLLLTERAMWSVVSEVSIDPEGGVVVDHRPAASRISDALPGDGADRRIVVDGAAGAVGRPAYSPDGRFVAFDRATCDRELVSAVGCALWGSEIVVALADGTGPQAVYPSASPRPPGTLDRNPAWSPDGTAIAFTRELPPSAGENSAIWLAGGLDIGAEPVAPADLVADTVVQLTSPVYAQTVGQIDEFDDEPAWSPDGARIAFTRGRIDTSYLTGVYESSIGSDILVEYRPTPGMHDQDIWVVAVGTGDVAPLLAEEVGAVPDDEGCPESATVVCPGGDDRGPDWSPDGARIVYEHTGWLYLADPAARADLGPLTGPRVLDPAADLPTYPDDALVPPPADPASPAAASFPALEWAQDPAWSPDGGRIAFAGQPRGRPDQRGVYWLTVPSDPGAREIRQVAQQPQPEMQPDWQPTADLAITLTAVPASVLLGGGSVLTAVVTNEGPATGFGATVALTLPAGLTAGALPAGCAAGTPVTCALGDIASGASATVAIPVTGATAGPQSATATTASRTVDPDPADNTASATVTVGAPAADLAVSLSAAPASIRVGEGSVLTAVVTNAGPQAAAGSTLTVNVPAGLAPGALPAGCAAGPPISCSLGDLPSGGSATVAIPVTGSAAGVQTATAQVQSTTADPDPSNNSAAASLTVAALQADVSVQMAVDPLPGYVGGPQTVTVTVVNAGPDAATVTLAVDLPEQMGPPDDDDCLTAAGCSLGLVAVGATVIREIETEPVEAFRERATAEVSADVSDPDTDNNLDSVRVRVLQPQVLLLPPLGPPGFVTQARGVDFPPGGRVSLEWELGLNASTTPIKVSKDGTFSVPVVVLPRDQLGPRAIVATRVKGLRFSPVSADFLVVPRTQSPPDFVGRG